ncbi:MAG TPA: Rieske 2Fe-2S domain-containing protein [Methylomirabilota bacterium]|nr:Rieske 2Fe-2S domain-containing protein [Methylomirabilota bacterium]
MPQDPVVRQPFVRVADLSEIRPGSSKLVVGPFDKPMALFNVDGEISAINAVCPHRGGPLAEGTLTGSVVSCPWHGWSFDVRTGRPDHPGGHSVAAYQVRVEGGAVYVAWLKR